MVNKEDVVKILEAKDKLENEYVNTESGDVGDFSFDEWVNMVCEELKIK